MMTTLVMMIIGGFVVIAGASGCLIPSANYEGDSTKWHRHFTPTVVMMTTKMIFFIELCRGQHKIQLLEYPIPAASASHPDSLFTMKKKSVLDIKESYSMEKSRKKVFKKFTT